MRNKPLYWELRGKSRLLFFGKFRAGQSLIEMLVAMGIGVIMLLGVIMSIVPAIKSQTDSNKSQVGAALAKEMLDGVRVLAEADWHNIDLLATTSANNYYISTTTPVLGLSIGIQPVTLGNTRIRRSFYVDDVYRDAGGNIISGVAGSLDPSTKKITVQYSWNNIPPKTLFIYLTRFASKIMWQTDWSGGDGVAGPVLNLGNQFASSSYIEYATSSGSIQIGEI
ncbi:MAG: prepilin-type N-terminal cleavage/methylation domain-containing protein [Candidatus Liptonbacteria bacterium]|nr:prepilin-type N-terminal cleavage/methylation domain-containing protein [Candidatus Liptonbacteria bacterium]